ncbi:DNA methylase [Actinorhabdospora filicis]|uniref:site-specific DNA-methyltransferase (adenine-specific) n=2 Tax=Actinorhabdospora filicis TaxID=1785913 RepID=A0A9W6SM37_9ACTN|nr:DNA methylase [Actinorhabdospora filicis]
MDHSALLGDLRQRVLVLEDDLRERAAEPEFHGDLRAEYDQAFNRERLSISYETWLEDQVTQAAVAWVLGTVFLRFCEDNRLIEGRYLAGPGDGTDIAVDRQREYFKNHPENTDRDWILTGFEEMSNDSPVVAGLFDKGHNPMWRITPSHPAAKELLGFWRERDTEGREVAYDFTDPEWDTRFLGDLYQDLSEAAKKRYALLQTPEFVEEFILKLTLEPALAEFGLEPRYRGPIPGVPNVLRVIDPTCGSGHFLLGAFHRLLKAWEAKAPGASKWDLIGRVLDGVHGVDKNPFAVSIARFRLFLAATKASHKTTLRDAPSFRVNIAVGDSLIHGRGVYELKAERDLFSEDEPHTFVTEDVSEFEKSVDILGMGTYHVVVGNPPYITVKDRRESENYRHLYSTCHGKYSLSIPFAERFFRLGIRGDNEGRNAGRISQITANSFMKREFGQKLIEEFFNGEVRLTDVIDTSGAYIPGHGTPTVILVGKNSSHRKNGAIRAVLGVRGEPSQPNIAAKGRVWTAITSQVDNIGSESEWVSVRTLEPIQLARYPWSLSGGGSYELTSTLDTTVHKLEHRLSRPIGFASFPGQDEVFFPGSPWLSRHNIDFPVRRPLIIGEVVRDWEERLQEDALVPYESDHTPLPYQENSPWGRHLWSQRSILQSTIGFDGKAVKGSSHKWWTWYRWIPERYATKLSITFAFVATHNHFTLDRGGNVFKQSAPVIKLSEDASLDHHLELLGILNSSTTCFWLKQVSQAKAGTENNSGGGNRWSPEAWIDRYEFTGTKLQEFPLPSTLPLFLGRRLDSLAQELAQHEPAATTRHLTRDDLDQAHDTYLHNRATMIALQEELDWQVYGLYDLLSEDESSSLISPDFDAVPEIKLGERAFEIVLARKMAAGETETQWFARHNSTPITEIPSHWPQWYQDLVQRRIDTISSNRNIALIERPEYKRRWATEPWEKKEQAALKSWLLDAIENRDLWYSPDAYGALQPSPQTINRLADRLSANDEFMSVLRLYAGPEATPVKVLTDLLTPEHVPFLSPLRYKDSGLRKRAQWEKTWELQRKEDLTGEPETIPVPPKYTSADFLKTDYWRHRGKLDIPKERFISYPGATPSDDGSLLLGWAGWDHRESAHALIALITERMSQLGWGREELLPLFAGLAEVMPWVRQWHDETDPATGINPAREYDIVRAELASGFGITDEDLAGWRPAPTARGRAKKKTQ